MTDLHPTKISDAAIEVLCNYITVLDSIGTADNEDNLSERWALQEALNGTIESDVGGTPMVTAAAEPVTATIDIRGRFPSYLWTVTYHPIKRRLRDPRDPGPIGMETSGVHMTRRGAARAARRAIRWHRLYLGPVVDA